MDSKPPKRKKNSAAGNADRQRRHRERHKMHALELSGEAYAKLRVICQQTGWTIRQAVAEALNLLQIQLDAEARSTRLAEMHKQAVAERAKQDELYPLPPAKESHKPKSSPEVKGVEGQDSFL